MCPSHASSLTGDTAVSIPGVLLSEQMTNQRTFLNGPVFSIRHSWKGASG